MFRYFIMSFMLGYSGNKLFGKDKSNINSIIVAVKITIILLVIDFITIYYF